jgi:surfeit locus 1 family protein
MSSRPPGTLRLLLRPSLLLLQVLGLTAVLAAVLLGRWQLDAWQLHRQDTAAELADSDPVPLGEVLGPDDPFPGTAVGRPVEVTGTWLPEATFRVADREQDGSTGSWVVTPVEVGGAALPVVLGWTADDDAVRPPEGSAALVGWLQPGEGGGAPDEDVNDDVLPTLRIASVSQRLDQDLYSGFAVLDTPAALRDDLTPVTPGSLPEAPTSTGLRNLLYGVEWFLFGGFAAFLWWRWTRDELRLLRDRAADEGVTGVNRVSEPTDDAQGPTEAGLPSRS